MKFCTFRPEINRKSRKLASSHSLQSVHQVNRYCRSSERKKEFDLSTSPAKKSEAKNSSQNSTKKSVNFKKENKILFFIDVKIKGNKTAKLSIYEKEEPEKTVERFGRINGLNLQQKKKLLENVKNFLEIESKSVTNDQIQQETPSPFNEYDDDSII